jgi:L-iditol 2-dehydrogenase
VLVTGAGPIGLLTLQTARAFGAAEVTVLDVNPSRLAVAASLGASRTADAREPSIAFHAPPDVLLECSGATAAAVAGLSALDRAGRAVLIGMTNDEVSLPVALIQQREFSVTGTFRYANTWPAAIGIVVCPTA